MHKVVELILTRMDSHPEEFVDSRKWTGLLQAYAQYFSAEEKEAVDAKTRELALDKMHSKVMEKLLDPDREKREEEERQQADAQNLFRTYTQTLQNPAQYPLTIPTTGSATTTTSNTSISTTSFMKFLGLA